MVHQLNKGTVEHQGAAAYLGPVAWVAGRIPPHLLLSNTPQYPFLDALPVKQTYVMNIDQKTNFTENLLQFFDQVEHFRDWVLVCDHKVTTAFHKLKFVGFLRRMSTNIWLVTVNILQPEMLRDWSDTYPRHAVLVVRPRFFRIHTRRDGDLSFRR